MIRYLANDTINRVSIEMSALIAPPTNDNVFKVKIVVPGINRYNLSHVLCALPKQKTVEVLMQINARIVRLKLSR